MEEEDYLLQELEPLRHDSDELYKVRDYARIEVQLGKRPLLGI
mgnify:CR=1 FL=1